ncbi:diguanylate cyclase (GGDEF)-like protein [Idiomarina fontislapidosi]|uniref:diguanylate cyclase n=1 Tax=Idiomarina fontislapidosi TaxID=263723 RepID=A0A432YB13_9GAMM|nr:diguanylate cyclase [Idiomarina fontislapidosi]PYE35161.1 diguanylate cyclase (GGDEF)-like protein [Idiomarina fontislapidosi]RUO58056.1 hypothetical protein CWE25_00190 [Idiomarina fontislapidosi]
MSYEKKLLDIADEFVAYIDKDKIYRYINPAYEKFLDLEEPIEGKHVADIFSEDSLGDVFEFQNRALAGDKCHFSKHIRLRDGRVRYWSARYIPYIDHDAGVVNGFFVLISDETANNAVLHLLKRVYTAATHENRGPDRSEAINMVLQEGCDYLGLDVGLVSKAIDDCYIIKWVHSRLAPIDPETELSLGQTYCSVTLNNKATTYTVKASECPVYRNHPSYQQFNFETYIGAPLYLNGHLWGTLSFSSPSARENEFSSLELETFQILTKSIQMLLNEHKLVKSLHAEKSELEVFAQTDELTGLANRSFITRYVTKQLFIMQPGEFVFALIDIDYFKRVNDSYGHEAGDEVLMQLAQRVKEGLRKTDIIARLGGEEFVVILNESNTTRAHATLNRLRQLVQQKPFKLCQTEITTTVSIGATFNVEGDDFRAIYNRADEQLYKAKYRGRDCLSSDFA